MVLLASVFSHLSNDNKETLEELSFLHLLLQYSITDLFNFIFEIFARSEISRVINITAVFNTCMSSLGLRLCYWPTESYIFVCYKKCFLCENNSSHVAVNSRFNFIRLAKNVLLFWNLP